MAEFQIAGELVLTTARVSNNAFAELRQQLNLIPDQKINVLVDGINKTVKATENLNKTNKSAENAANKARAAIKREADSLQDFGDKAGLALRRFTAFTIAATGVFGSLRVIKDGIRDAVNFNTELTRVAQVTGTAVNVLGGLRTEIGQLSAQFGTSAKDLAQVATTLAQAGLSANQTKAALKALAQTTVAPTFSDITKTTEGAIASLRQFNLAAEDLGVTLNIINAVSAKFAVESDDIITGITKAGAAFSSANSGIKSGNDSLAEFIALFTSVRATTRESAETIGTGLRTIFTRIQRPRTIQFLRDFGVELTDLNGKFVGPYKAIQRLGDALRNLNPRDLRFASIVEEVGGFRQVSRVIPLIQQTRLQTEALNTALTGQNSIVQDLAIKQEDLGFQYAKVREEFATLLRDITNTNTFQELAKGVLSLSSALIKLADAAKDVIPLIGILATFKGIQGLIGSGGLASFGFRTITGKPRIPVGRQSGGLIGGHGSGDKIPALLEPNEYVLNRKAVEAIGVNNLDKLNNNTFPRFGASKFQTGGFVRMAVGGSAIPKNLGGTEIRNTLAEILTNIVGDVAFDYGQIAQDAGKRAIVKLKSGNKFILSTDEEDLKVPPQHVKQVAKAYNISEDELSKYTVRGSYNKKKNTLAVNTNLFADKDRAESTVRHELYHFASRNNLFSKDERSELEQLLVDPKSKVSIEEQIARKFTGTKAQLQSSLPQSKTGIIESIVSGDIYNRLSKSKPDVPIAGAGKLSGFIKSDSGLAALLPEITDNIKKLGYSAEQTGSIIDQFANKSKDSNQLFDKLSSFIDKGTKANIKSQENIKIANEYNQRLGTLGIGYNIPRKSNIGQAIQSDTGLAQLKTVVDELQKIGFSAEEITGVLNYASRDVKGSGEALNKAFKFTANEIQKYGNAINASSLKTIPQVKNTGYRETALAVIPGQNAVTTTETTRPTALGSKSRQGIVVPRDPRQFTLAMEEALGLNQLPIIDGNNIQLAEAGSSQIIDRRNANYNNIDVRGIPNPNTGKTSRQLRTAKGLRLANRYAPALLSAGAALVDPESSLGQGIQAGGLAASAGSLLNIGGVGTAVLGIGAGINAKLQADQKNKEAEALDKLGKASDQLADKFSKLGISVNNTLAERKAGQEFQDKLTIFADAQQSRRTNSVAGQLATGGILAGIGLFDGNTKVNQNLALARGGASFYLSRLYGLGLGAANTVLDPLSRVSGDLRSGARTQDLTFGLADKTRQAQNSIILEDQNKEKQLRNKEAQERADASATAAAAARERVTKLLSRGRSIDSLDKTLLQTSVSDSGRAQLASTLGQVQLGREQAQEIKKEIDARKKVIDSILKFQDALDLISDGTARASAILAASSERNSIFSGNITSLAGGGGLNFQQASAFSNIEAFTPQQLLQSISKTERSFGGRLDRGLVNRAINLPGLQKELRDLERKRDTGTPDLEDDIEKLTRQADAAQKSADALVNFENATNKAVATLQQELSVRRGLTQQSDALSLEAISSNGSFQERLYGLLGKEDQFTGRGQILDTKVKSLTGGPTDVNSILENITALNDARKRNLNDTTKNPFQQAIEDSNLVEALDRNNQALKLLSEDISKLSDIQSKLNEIQKQREVGGALIEDTFNLTFDQSKERFKQLAAFQLFQQSQGDLAKVARAGFTNQDISAGFRLRQQFGLDETEKERERVQFRRNILRTQGIEDFQGLKNRFGAENANRLRAAFNSRGNDPREKELIEAAKEVGKQQVDAILAQKAIIDKTIADFNTNIIQSMGNNIAGLQQAAKSLTEKITIEFKPVDVNINLGQDLQNFKNEFQNSIFQQVKNQLNAEFDKRIQGLEPPRIPG